MKIVYNRFIPFRGFVAINLFGVVFARREFRPLGADTVRHEQIHTAQMRETAFVGFYVIYLCEWLFLLAKYRDKLKAYRSIRFEKEAYKYMDCVHYLKERKAFTWLCM